jgi:hypothetical protein
MDGLKRNDADGINENHKNKMATACVYWPHKI